jgi:hypothetical protein
VLHTVCENLAGLSCKNAPVFIMKYISIIALLMCASDVLGQDSIPKFAFEWGFFKQSHLLIDYSYNFRVEDKPGHHVLELGFAHSKFMHQVESANTSYYVANEFIINSRDFSIGPKVGAYVGVWGFCAGAELAWYTNFHDESLQLTPFFGLGSERGKIYMSFHIPITNRKYQEINILSLGISLQLIPLSKKKRIR